MTVADVTVNVTDNNTLDTAAPTVVSITRTLGTSPTNANSLNWFVEFSEPVVNVDAADFAVTGTTAGVVVVTESQGSPSVWLVSIQGGNLADLNGTVMLGFASGQNIADEAGNLLTATTPTGDNEEYVVDNTAPTVGSISRFDPAASPTAADSLTWDLFFSEEVTGVDAADFTVEGTDAMLTVEVTSNPLIYTVTISGGNLATLTATVTLGFADDQDIADRAGNALESTATDYGQHRRKEPMTWTTRRRR